MGSRRSEIGRKLELIVFAGEDTYGWIGKVEHYFHVMGVEDEDKLDVALVVMEGEALIWYELWEAQVLCLS